MNLLEYYKSMPDKIIVNYDKEYDLYCCKYNSLGMDWDDERIRMARGIILDREGNIVSKGYDKFFNYGELRNRENFKSCDLSEWGDEGFAVTEKIDGSMMLVTFHEDRFIVSSSSSITNDYTNLFREKLKEIGLINENLDTFKSVVFKNICKDCCFVFEYVSPETQIVIPYEKSDIIFHGLINKKDYKLVFLNEESSNYISALLNVNSKAYYKMSKEDIIERQKTDENIEGWVVQFESGKMIKFKTEWYLKNHDKESFFFGNPYTKRKISSVIDWYFDDVIDDYIAKANVRLNDYYSKAIHKIINVLKEKERIFDYSLEEAKKRLNTDIKPKEYVGMFGSSDLIARIYFNLYRKKDDLETFKYNYIKNETIKHIKE